LKPPSGNCSAILWPTRDLIVTDAVRAVADQIRSARLNQKSPDESLVEPNLEIVPKSASSPPPSWRQREQARIDRREELRLAQMVERRRIEELRLAEQAEQRRAQERAREREAAERREQRRLVEQIEQQRRRELQLTVQVQLEQRREAHFRDLQRIVDDLNRAANPPPAEQPDTPPFEEGTGRLGYSDFNPRLMTQPVGWW
jgi:acyl-CoA reductase-like NAD-dependent aldehyde dehydrogenase